MISQFSDYHTIIVDKEKVMDIDIHGFCIGLRNDVLEWLFENVGLGLLPDGRSIWTVEDHGLSTVVFYFRRAEHAVLFKLTWT